MSQHKKIPLLAAMILALLGLLFAGYWYLHGRYFESTDNAYLQSEVTGIGSKLSGYISEVLVTDNQPVKAGQLIARLDDREYKTKVAEAEADLRLNQATAENLAATRTQQLSLIRQAEAKVSSANAEQVRAGLQVNQAQEQEAKAALQAARERLLVLDAEAKQNQAKLALSAAQLEQAKLELAYTELRAPADGIIGKRSLRAGLYVQSGMQVASLVPLQQVWVEANFKETQLLHMQPGQKVEVILDAYPDQPVEGIIDSLAPATGAKFALLPPENATGNFTKIVQRVPVKIRIPDPGALAGKLLPGLSTEVIVDTRSPDPVVAAN
ncbi:HlyD family secretion protein [Aeromonas dhakensis]|uniref:HlyD family secretion protein n=1 Tax=Aeromonas dhakensis TaxID=196024 RepID=UPI0020B1E9E7|nr:HlyD family secretion protein [Aeromonas dhakensis]WPS55831.1 HlyD family secretion protein [Aeromonas dhakensis]WRT73380.1 HlyD family secretion protein [Aeromonas dhakensis]CAD7489563.1 hemolysin D [Aeromonas dhakensis]CAD7494137.1 hemolysin D [Aeromonas dhakensis]CAD7494240.1 hemolysin D [Aeromonas dhakensis]